MIRHDMHGAWSNAKGNAVRLIQPRSAQESASSAQGTAQLRSFRARESILGATSEVKVFVGLAEIFPLEAIVVGLKNRTKQGAITELLHHMVGMGLIMDREEQGIIEGILVREKLGSTAVYDGVAFPHCRSIYTERFVGVLGIEPDGIPFDSGDRGLIHSVFLFLGPLDRREELYEILGRIIAIARDKTRRAQLRGCRTAEAAHRFLLELDRS